MSDRVEIVIGGKYEAGSAFNAAKGDVSGLGGAVQQTDQKSGGFFKNLIGAAGGFIATNVIGTITGQFGNLVSGMIGGNAAFEDYNARFTTLLGSADSAKQRMADLAKFGASTPFELPQVVDADIVLQGFGLHSEEAAKKFGFSGEQIRTIAGDVASGTGSDFKDMALLLGKFSAGATGEAISRFQEMGITSKDELTKMGLEFDKSGALLSPLPESMNVILNLMKTKYGGLMDVQSKTFNGMMSNLQDWVGGTLRTIGQPIFEILKDKLGVVVQFLSSPEVMASITAFADGLAKGIGVAIDWLSNVGFPALIEAWNTLSPVINVVIGAVQFAAQIFQQTGEQNVSTFTSTFDTIYSIISSVSASIQIVVQTVFGAINAFWKANGEDIMAFVKQMWAQISEIIKIAIALIKATIVPAFQAIAAFIAAHKEQIVGILSAAWTIIKGVITVVTAVIKGILATFLAVVKGDWAGAWTAIKEMFDGIWKGIKLIADGALSYLKNVLSMAWDAIKMVASAAWNYIKENILQATWNGIKTLISGAIDNIKSTLSGAWTSVKNTASSMWEQTKEAIMSPFRSAKEGISTLATGGDSIKSKLSSAWSQIKSDASSSWGSITDTIKDKFDAAVGKVRSVVNDIKDALSWDSIKDGARSAWNGIADAIGDAFGSAVSHVKGVLNRIIDGMNDAIDAFNSLPGPDLDHIPRLARGTDFWQGGPAIVGERGPELLYLPRGSQVVPNNRIGNVGVGGEKHYHLHLNTASTAEEVSLMQNFSALEATTMSWS